MNRRHDIDWLRVIAIGLLLIYHIAIGFQPWGIMIGFVTNEKPWGPLWVPMAMLNVWRIPLLFFVSGMGVCFAMRQRGWQELLRERAIRILLPFVFGSFVIVPVSIWLWQRYYGFPQNYNPNPGHLWFLGNIFAYVLLMMPLFFYLKKKPDGKLFRGMRRMLSTPWGLVPVLLCFIAEFLIVRPWPYELYAMTWHGFFLGMLAFLFGFCFVFAGDGFWKMILKWRWLFASVAMALFAMRVTLFQMNAPGYLLVTESQCWIFSVLAFGHKYLNRPGNTLRYLSEAAYPVYIIHMIVLYLGASLIFPMEMNAPWKFLVLTLFTFGGCFLMYEFLIRRVNFIRVLFGLKIRRAKTGVNTSTVAQT